MPYGAASHLFPYPLIKPPNIKAIFYGVDISLQHLILGETMDTSINKQLPILIVNEVLLTRKIVKSCLSNLGFENVMEAEDGNTALEKMKNQSFQLVISEWDISHSTGIELLKQLRASDGHRELPVLMITSDAKKDDVIEAVKAGVSNYLMRPFTPDQLQSKLDAIFCVEEPFP